MTQTSGPGLHTSPPPVPCCLHTHGSGWWSCAAGNPPPARARSAPASGPRCEPPADCHCSHWTGPGPGIKPPGTLGKEYTPKSHSSGEFPWRKVPLVLSGAMNVLNFSWAYASPGNLLKHEDSDSGVGIWDSAFLMSSQVAPMTHTLSRKTPDPSNGPSFPNPDCIPISHPSFPCLIFKVTPESAPIWFIHLPLQ